MKQKIVFGHHVCNTYPCSFCGAGWKCGCWKEVNQICDICQGPEKDGEAFWTKGEKEIRQDLQHLHIAMAMNEYRKEEREWRADLLSFLSDYIDQKAIEGLRKKYL